MTMLGIPKADYQAMEPMYDQLRSEIPKLRITTVTQVQHVYRFGYNRASRILEHLADEGVLNWDRMTGKYGIPQDGK